MFQPLCPTYNIQWGHCQTNFPLTRHKFCSLEAIVIVRYISEGKLCHQGVGTETTWLKITFGMARFTAWKFSTSRYKTMVLLSMSEPCSTTKEVLQSQKLLDFIFRMEHQKRFEEEGVIWGVDFGIRYTFYTVIFYMVQNLYGHFLYGRFLYGHFLYVQFLYSSKFIQFKIYTVQNLYGHFL
jgi:hypothetical protein